MSNLIKKPSKLPITLMIVTNHFNRLLFYSIKSISHIVDEILIFDDTKKNKDNEISKFFNNVKILYFDFKNDLGKKKQYLLEHSSNNIVMRWDNDFILYDEELLEKSFNILDITDTDGIIANNLNIMYDFKYLNRKHPYVTECYIFKKNLLIFKNNGKYIDYPYILKKNPKFKYFKNPIFLHMSNFKSAEENLYRSNMIPYLMSNYTNYYKYMLCEKKKLKLEDLSYDDIINAKKDFIKYIKNSKIDYNNIIKNEIDVVKKLDVNFVKYINKTYKIKNISNNEFIFIAPQTENLTKLFYWGGQYSYGNFGDILSYYIFEKLSGYASSNYNLLELSDVVEEHYMTIGSIINYSTPQTIIWGSGMISKYLEDIKFKKILCVRGPKTYKKLIDKGYKIPRKFGDPALMTPLIYKSKSIVKYKIGIIPHIKDYDFIKDNFKSDTLLIINLKIKKDNKSLEKVIDDINSCEFILSSSLRGIILSNAYNIPVVRFKNYQLAGDDIKFIDYFESIYSDKYLCQSGDNIFNLIKNIENTKKIYKTPDLIKDRQKDLIDTCPFIDYTLKELLFN